MLSRRPSAALGTAQDCPMEVLCRLRPSETNSNARSGSRKGAGNHKTPTSEHSSRRKFPALDVPRLFTEAPDALGLDRTCVQALCPNQVLFNSIPLGTPPTFKNGGSGGAAWQGSPSPNSPPTSLTARSRSSLIATTPTPRALSMDRSDVLSATGSLPPPKDFRFTFSDVFPPLTDQHVVYERAALPVVEDVLQGYNGSVLVYGQTGSGKTYTMFGPPVLTSKKGQASRGLSTSTPGSALPAWAGCAPRALEDIFKRIHLTAEEQGETAVQFEVHISFIEVYMERVRDLLSPLPLKPGSEYACPLKVREDVSGGSFYVEGCLTPRVVSMEEAMRLVLAGLKRRMTGQTAMNDTSSRSHCLLSVVVKSVRAGPGGEVRVGRLALVDLAGSEKVSKTKSLGVQLEEAKQINKSLTTLSLVIQALSTNSSHVPFRNSVLTKLLKESLGGNARTSMIVCCSMERENAAETLSSLRFGALATKVVNRAVINKKLSVEELQLKLEVAQAEIMRLNKLVEARDRTATAPGSPGSGSALKESYSVSSSGGPLAPPVTSTAQRWMRGRESSATDFRAGIPPTPKSSVSREGSLASTVIDNALNDRMQEMGDRRWEQRSRELEEELANADETMIALMMERDDYRDQRESFAEECQIWEEEFRVVRRRLGAKEAQVALYRRAMKSQERDLKALLQALETEWREVCTARATLEEAERRGGTGSFAAAAGSQPPTLGSIPKGPGGTAGTGLTSILVSGMSKSPSSAAGSGGSGMPNAAPSVGHLPSPSPFTESEAWLSVTSVADSPLTGQRRDSIPSQSPSTPSLCSGGPKLGGRQRPQLVLPIDEPEPVAPHHDGCSSLAHSHASAGGEFKARRRSAQAVLTSQQRYLLNNMSLLSDDEMVVSAMDTFRDGPSLSFVPSVSNTRQSVKGSERSSPSSSTETSGAGAGFQARAEQEQQEGSIAPRTNPVTPLSPSRHAANFQTPVFPTAGRGEAGLARTATASPSGAKSTSASHSADTLPPSAENHETRVKVLEHHVALLKESLEHERQANVALRVILASEEKWRHHYARMEEGRAVIAALQLRSRQLREQEAQDGSVDGVGGGDEAPYVSHCGTGNSSSAKTPTALPEAAG